MNNICIIFCIILSYSLVLSLHSKYIIRTNNGGSISSTEILLESRGSPFTLTNIKPNFGSTWSSNSKSRNLKKNDSSISTDNAVEFQQNLSSLDDDDSDCSHYHYGTSISYSGPTSFQVRLDWKEKPKRFDLHII